MANYDLTQTGAEVQAYIDSIPVIDVSGTQSGSTIVLATNPYSAINTNYSADCGSLVRLTVGSDVYLIPITEYDGSAYTGAVKSNDNFVNISASSSAASGAIETLTPSFATGEEISDVGIDALPLPDSENLVESGGVITYIAGLTEIAAIEDVEIDIPVETYDVIYVLTNITTSSPTEIVSGQTLSVTLTPAEGYKLPVSVSVTNATVESWNKTTGVLVISNPTNYVVIQAAGELASEFSITYDLTDLTATTQPASIFEGATAEIVLEADEDYLLPSTVTVTNADIVSYDSSTGVLIIGNAVANVTVEAEGVSTNVKITFADAGVKAKLVALYDTSGDGELTTSEAAAVSTAIPYSTFRNDTTITSFDEFEYFINVPSIAGNTFNGCTSLASIIIPSAVNTITGSAFQGCSALSSITIPSNVTTIGNSAFQSSGLTSISIPSTVTSLGTGVCKSCTSLLTASIAVNINGSTFYGCNHLTSVTISEGVAEIGASAFYNCSALTSLTLPSTITGINGGFAANCSSLTTVTCLATTPPSKIGASSNAIFASVANLATIYVPHGCGDTYKAHAAWSAYSSKIVELPE